MRLPVKVVQHFLLENCVHTYFRRIETNPEYSGMAPSCIGMAARFASSIVTTNSAGSISPICRLPMSRTQKISTIYSRSVRKYDKIKKSPLEDRIPRGNFFMQMQKPRFQPRFLQQEKRRGKNEKDEVESFDNIVPISY